MLLRFHSQVSFACCSSSAVACRSSLVIGGILRKEKHCALRVRIVRNRFAFGTSDPGSSFRSIVQWWSKNRQGWSSYWFFNRNHNWRIGRSGNWHNWRSSALSSDWFRYSDGGINNRWDRSRDIQYRNMRRCQWNCWGWIFFKCIRGMSYAGSVLNTPKLGLKFNQELNKSLTRSLRG